MSILKTLKKIKEEKLASLKKELRELSIEIMDSMDTHKEKVVFGCYNDIYGIKGYIQRPFTDTFGDKYLKQMGKTKEDRMVIDEWPDSDHFPRYTTVSLSDYIDLLEDYKDDNSLNDNDKISILSNIITNEKFTITINQAYKALYDFMMKEKMCGFIVDW